MTDRKHAESEFSRAALDHIDALFGYAMALTRDRSLAEDLVQETYLRAVRAFGRLVPDSNLKSWLFAIMRNAWLNQVRHEDGGNAIVDHPMHCPAERPAGTWRHEQRTLNLWGNAIMRS